MKVGNLLNARPQWYDRNPNEQGGLFEGIGLAPTGSTTRLSYTVPAARKFLYETVAAYVRRETVAAPLGRAVADCVANPLNGNAAILPYVLLQDNTVNAQRDVNVGYQAVYIAGASFLFQTSDNSTGGTCSFMLTYKGTSFDN